jgi:hypothetical protein
MAMNGRVDVPAARRAPKPRQNPFEGWSDQSNEAGPFDFSGVDPELVQNVIAEWTALGYAITFGRTSDGGAMGVHLLANGRKQATYHATVDELETRLQEIVARARSLAG